ncbi:MAG TPA: hypothetical protein VH593_07375 [Ktedonobacteraceae bacterium]
MSQLPDREFVIKIAYDVVKQVAPNELSSFQTISAAYKRDPRNMRRQQAVKDNDLGFGGIGGEIHVLAPTILLIVEQVLIQIGRDAAGKGAGALFHHLGEKIFKRSSSTKKQNQPGSPPYLLTQADIQAYVYQAARKARVSEAKANEIAKTLVENLKARKEELEGL